MKTTRVMFVNRAGYRLSGLLDTPAEGAVRAYGLLAHCFTCGKDLKSFVNINKELTAVGIAVLRFDFSGLGLSAGDFSDSNFSSNQRDLEDAATFLAENYAAPRLLVGHSLGGAAVLCAAPKIPSARAVVTIAAPSGPAHLGAMLARARDDAMESGEAAVEIGGRSFTLKKQFFEDLESHESRDRVARVNCALLILHSPDDESVEIENASRIFRAAQHPKSFVALHHADHLLLDEAAARYAGAVIGAWASAYLE